MRRTDSPAELDTAGAESESNPIKTVSSSPLKVSVRKVKN